MSGEVGWRHRGHIDDQRTSITSVAGGTETISDESAEPTSLARD